MISVSKFSKSREKSISWRFSIFWSANKCRWVLDGTWSVVAWHRSPFLFSFLHFSSPPLVLCFVSLFFYKPLRELFLQYFRIFLLIRALDFVIIFKLDREFFYLNCEDVSNSVFFQIQQRTWYFSRISDFFFFLNLIPKILEFKILEPLYHKVQYKFSILSLCLFMIIFCLFSTKRSQNEKVHYWDTKCGKMLWEYFSHSSKSTFIFFAFRFGLLIFLVPSSLCFPLSL